MHISEENLYQSLIYEPVMTKTLLRQVKPDKNIDMEGLPSTPLWRQIYGGGEAGVPKNL
jgi:hypothetical protein